LTSVPLQRTFVLALQLPHEIKNLHGFEYVTPSWEQPAEDTRILRGLIPELLSEIRTLPGGRTFTIVIAGAGVVGGVGTRPVPVSVTASGLVAAFVVTVTLADLLPAVAGEKTTFQVQDAEDAKDAPQVFVLMENSVALAPVTRILVIVSGPVPLFVRLTEVGGLEVPSSWLP